MTFASTITKKETVGSKRFHYGTFTNAIGDSGGNITTGLGTCEQLFLQVNSAAVIANAPVTNETFPLEGGVVTIVTGAHESGQWMAIGFGL